MRGPGLLFLLVMAVLIALMVAWAAAPAGAWWLHRAGRVDDEIAWLEGMASVLPFGHTLDHRVDGLYRDRIALELRAGRVDKAVQALRLARRHARQTGAAPDPQLTVLGMETYARAADRMLQRGRPDLAADWNDSLFVFAVRDPDPRNQSAALGALLDGVDLRVKDGKPCAALARVQWARQGLGGGSARSRSRARAATRTTLPSIAITRSEPMTSPAHSAFIPIERLESRIADAKPNYTTGRGGRRGQPLPLLPRRAVRPGVPDRDRHPGLHPQDRDRQRARLGADDPLGEPARLLVRAGAARSRCCAWARASTTTGTAIRRSRSAGCSATRSSRRSTTARPPTLLSQGARRPARRSRASAPVRPRSRRPATSRSRACAVTLFEKRAHRRAGSTRPASRPTRCTSRARSPRSSSSARSA